jgi:hypothetical protein
MYQVASQRLRATAILPPVARPGDPAPAGPAARMQPTAPLDQLVATRGRRASAMSQPLDGFARN